MLCATQHIEQETNESFSQCARLFVCQLRLRCRVPSPGNKVKNYTTKTTLPVLIWFRRRRNELQTHVSWEVVQLQKLCVCWTVELIASIEDMKRFLGETPFRWIDSRSKFHPYCPKLDHRTVGSRLFQPLLVRKLQIKTNTAGLGPEPNWNQRSRHKFNPISARVGRPELWWCLHDLRQKNEINCTF